MEGAWQPGLAGLQAHLQHQKAKDGKCDPWQGTAHCPGLWESAQCTNTSSRRAHKEMLTPGSLQTVGVDRRGPPAEHHRSPHPTGRHNPRGRQQDKAPWLCPYASELAAVSRPAGCARPSHHLTPSTGRLRRMRVRQSGPPGPPRRNAGPGLVSEPAIWLYVLGPGRSPRRSRAGLSLPPSSQCKGHFSKVSPNGLSWRSCPLRSGLGPEPGGDVWGLLAKAAAS